MNNLVKNSFVNALATAAYVILVVMLITSIDNMGRVEDSKFFPVFPLMLLVLSAAVTGSLVFAKPIMMFINGQKSEAVKMLMYTIGWLAAFTIVAFLVVVSVS